jgi:hypothetical protein
MVAQLGIPDETMVELASKPLQHRYAGGPVETKTNPEPAKSTKTAVAMGPAGGERTPATQPGEE